MVALKWMRKPIDLVNKNDWVTRKGEHRYIDTNWSFSFDLETGLHWLSTRDFLFTSKLIDKVCTYGQTNSVVSHPNISTSSLCSSPSVSHLSEQKSIIICIYNVCIIWTGAQTDREKSNLSKRFDISWIYRNIRGYTAQAVNKQLFVDGKTTMKTWMRDERDNDTLANAMQCDKTYLIIWHYLLQLSKHQSGKDTNIIPKVMCSNKTIVAGRQTNFQITSWPLILIVSTPRISISHIHTYYIYYYRYMFVFRTLFSIHVVRYEPKHAK